MPVPGADQVGERPLDELVQNASQQGVALAREQLDVARAELIARARRAAPGLGLIGGGAFLGALASGTGTASLILLLARRPGASAAALGVTAAYAGAGAFLAREGLVRLQDASAPVPDVDIEDESAAEDAQSPKRRARSATKSAQQRIKSPTKSAARTSAGRKVNAKSAAARGRASRTQTERRRRS